MKKNLTALSCGLGAIIAQLVFMPRSFALPFTIVFTSLAVLVIILAIRTRDLTVEKYIEKSNANVRFALANIHNSILYMFHGGEYKAYANYLRYDIPKIAPMPTYYFDDTPVLATQGILGGKRICIYPMRGPFQHRQAFSNAFSDRLRQNGCKVNKGWEIYVSVNQPIDFELIKDIFRFEVQIILEHGKSEVGREFFYNREKEGS